MSKRFFAIIGGFALLCGVSTVAMSGATTAGAASTPPARDGSTSSSAAPSCWSIKQNFPASGDGIYWLWTPKLTVPEQFYCDMTTDGGGWVLIGRGRDGWSFPYQGQDTAKTLRETITGPAAFSPASLPTTTVDGLLNGGRMDGLADGIRVRRAANTTGTAWQDVRMKVKNYGSWSWAFGGGIYLSSISFNGTVYPLSSSNYVTNTTANTTISDDTQRITTTPSSIHNYRAGFSYGATVSTGTNSPTNYLWQLGTEKYALPFSQVFVRPKLMEADIAPATPSFAPDSGLSATTKPFHLDNRPVTGGWGVTGLNLGTAVPTNGSYVTAFAQVGGVIYVGGKFLQVQHGVGGPAFTQSYIAAFNKDTGEWIPTFNPVLDGPVWEMKASPDGSKLFVGGEFTSVNGVTNTSYLAALDPATGAPVPTWSGYVQRPNNVSDVRAMDIQDGWLYVSGNFTKASGGFGTQYMAPFSVSRLARFRVSDGRPDGTWKPSLEIAAQDLDASAQGDRVYVVGLFKTLNGATLTVPRFAVINTTNGQAVPGLKDYQQNVTPPTEWLNAVLEVGDKVYIGGSQHVLHQYARSDMTFERSHEAKAGGDFQALAADQGILYASCHCNNWQYQDSTSWSDPSGYSQVDQINYFGAYDISNNIEVNRDFQPTQLDATGSGGEGPWELMPDSDHCLWVGGDLVRSGATPSPFYGGFEKFCPADTVAPTAPTNLKSSVDGAANVTLSWNAAADDSGAAPLYEVLRDDPNYGTIVIGSTYSRSFVDPAVTGQARYFVRAVDPDGNKSATTASLTLQPLAPVAATLAQTGDTWSYRADGTDLGTAWRQPGYDASSWATGTSVLGWGNGNESTVIPSAATTQYFVRTVNVANPSSYKTLTVRLMRDDGAAVYVNGVEVVRDNLPAGALSQSTPALNAVSGNQETTWYEYQVPASVLVAGQNTIAVELHQTSANNGDGTFDFSLLARTTVEANAPTAPNLAVAGTTENRVDLQWTSASDDQGVIGYSIRRNGTPVAFTSGLTWSDGDATANTSYVYEVRAVDRSGNVSAWASASAVTLVATSLVRSGDTWSYRSAAGEPPAGWNQPSFDASSWPSGRSQLGWGDGDEATVIPSGTLTQHFVRHFNVSGSARYQSLLLRLIRDDGAAVYINGVEVARSGLPAGALTAGTFANISVSGAAESTWNEFTVPGALLHDGDNVIAAEVHQNTNNNADSSFDLELALKAPAETTAPTKPSVTVAGTTDTTATLNWTASTDDTGVFGYILRRNGQIITVSTGTSFVDTGLAAHTQYSYMVQAVDASGNVSPAGGALAVTTGNPKLVDFGSIWKYRFDGVDQGPTWMDPAFADSSWTSAPSKLGIGFGDEATVIGPAVAPTPITAYFRRDFDVADAASVTSLTMDVVRDDGFVAYINGVEVGRNNMAPGTVSYATRPSTAVSLRSDGLTPVTLPVPPGVLHSGTNSFAVEMHQANATSTDIAFNLRLTATFSPVPAVSLETPVSGAKLASSTTTVNGLCTVGVGNVTVAVDGPSATTVTAPCADNAWTVSLPLADGSYTAVASQDDGVGHHPTSATPSFTVDTQAPTVSVTAPAAGSTVTSTTPAISGTCSSSDGPVHVTVAGPTWQTFDVSCSSGSWTMSTGLTDDSYTVAASQTDASGNVGNATAVSFTVDSTAPVTADDTAQIGNAWRALPVTVKLTPTDGGSGVAQTYYTTDGSTPTTSSPTGTLVPLTNGQYTIKYFSVDNAGNAEPVRTASTMIRIDQTAPTVTVTGPANGARVNAASFTASCPSVGICGTLADTGAGEQRVELTVTRSSDSKYWNGTGWQTALSNQVATGSVNWSIPMPTTQLTNGYTYTITTRGFDVLGNQSAPTASAFTYDTTAPSTSSTAVGNKNGRVEVGDSFSVTFSEAVAPASLPSTGTLTLSRSSSSATTWIISGLSNSAVTTGTTGYVSSGSGTRTLNYPGSLTLSVDRLTATFTVTGACTGTQCGSATTAPASGGYQYRIAPTIRDVAGNSPSTGTVTSSSTVMF